MMKKKKIICIVLLVVAILVAIYFVWFKKPKEKETSLIELTGNSECIRINTEENVKVILKDVTFNCDKEPAIFIEKAGSVEIELNGNNSIVFGSNEKFNSAIYSFSKLNISGSGSLKIESGYKGIYSTEEITIKNISLNINSFDDGIKSEDKLVIDSSVYESINGGGYKNTSSEAAGKGVKAKSMIDVVDSTISIDSVDDSFNTDGTLNIKSSTLNLYSGDDAVHADEKINLDSSVINIKESKEAIESKYTYINSSTVDIKTEDDGLNAVNKENKKDAGITIKDSTVLVVSKGDGIDSNGYLNIEDSSVYLESSNMTAESALDYDETFTLKNSNFIALSSSRHDECGPLVSNQPYLQYYLSKTQYGDIELGGFKYTPKLNYFSQIIISVKGLKLSQKYDLKIREDKYEVMFDSFDKKIIYE